MIKSFLSAQTKSLGFSSIILAAAFLMSSFLGLLRDRLLASNFGVGDELDIYYAAFKIPDFVATILVLGAISAAIIPVFSSLRVKSEKEAWSFASSLINIMAVSLICVCAILAYFTPNLIILVAPGFKGDKLELLINLTRIMFLSPIFLGISTIVSSILQVFHRFLATVLAPVMYNLGIILGILFLVPKFGLNGLAYGVILGGILHLLVQLPAFFLSGFKLNFSFNTKNSSIRKVFVLMLPRVLGLTASQINLIVITAIASTLISGSIAVFNLANNLSAVFIGFIAASFSSAVFPSLSIAFSRGDKELFSKKFSLVFRQILFLLFPAGFLFFVLRAHIVRVVLGSGKFGWLDTRLTAACLGVMALSIFAQGLIYLLSKTFYASHNTKIPAIVSIFSVFLNIVLSYVFVFAMNSENWFSIAVKSFLKLSDLASVSVIGLAMAITLSSLFQFALLLILLSREIIKNSIKEIIVSFVKTLISSAAAVAGSYAVLYYLAQVIDARYFYGIFTQGFLAGIFGVLIYIILSFILKSSEIITLKSSIGDKLKFLYGAKTN